VLRNGDAEPLSEGLAEVDRLVGREVDGGGGVAGAIELLPAVSAMIVATSQRRWKMVRASMTFWIR